MVFDWRLASYDKELAWFAQCIDKWSSAFKANDIPPAFENDTFQIPKSSSTDLASCKSQLQNQKIDIIHCNR